MLKYIMGLLENKKQQNKSIHKNLEFELETKEIEIILRGMQNTTFKGKDIEMVYNLAIKLQDLYTKSLNRD